MELTQFSPASALIAVLAMALLPYAAVMVTSFTKIVVVLSLLRSALGAPQVPPNIVLNGLALMLSVYVMYPVGQEMAHQASLSRTPVPGAPSVTHIVQTARSAAEPLREFLIRHTPAKERAFFLKTAQRSQGASPAAGDAPTETDFIVILPAFTVSQLASAFQIGFLIFLPFLVIDLVVSNILMSMGMMMLSPTSVSLPFKLLVFVMVDGWAKLSHGLVLSYQA